MRLVLCIILLCSGVATAGYSPQYNQDDLSVTVGLETTETILVINDFEDSEADAEISVAGEARDYVTLSETEMTLAPSEQRQISFSVSARNESSGDLKTHGDQIEGEIQIRIVPTSESSGSQNVREDSAPLNVSVIGAGGAPEGLFSLPVVGGVTSEDLVVFGIFSVAVGVLGLWAWRRRSPDVAYS